MSDDSQNPPPDLLARIERCKSAIGRVGVFVRGSVVKRYMPCGTPGCRCMADPPQLHGPYFQWSGWVDGESTTLRLRPAEVALWQQWIENGRQLDRIVAEWEALGAEAVGHVLQARPGGPPKGAVARKFTERPRERQPPSLPAQTPVASAPSPAEHGRFPAGIGAAPRSRRRR